MANVEVEVLCILLKTLFDQGFIPREIYDSAQNLVHSSGNLPEFFAYGREKGGA